MVRKNLMDYFLYKMKKNCCEKFKKKNKYCKKCPMLFKV